MKTWTPRMCGGIMIIVEEDITVLYCSCGKMTGWPGGISDVVLDRAIAMHLSERLN